jgi:hypothetical protein
VHQYPIKEFNAGLEFLSDNHPIHLIINGFVVVRKYSELGVLQLPLQEVTPS